MRTRPVPCRFLAFALLSLPAPPAAAQFVDRTVEGGLTWGGPTWGAALGDMDGDGDPDLVAGHHVEPPVLHWNDGAALFDVVAHPQPWAGPTDRHGALLLSLDADTDLELFVTHGADGGGGAEANELYRNDGSGTLRYLLGAAGMSDGLGRPRSASAADVDGDGRVDVWTAEAPDAVSRNSLFRNSGSLTFSDIAAAAGLDEALGTIGGVFGDVDDDGDPDLLVGGEEFGRPTTLWRNDGGVFADASAAFTPGLPVASGADWGDADGDGDLDLAIAAGNVGLWDVWAPGDTLTYYFNTRWGDTGLDALTIPGDADTAWGVFRLLGHADSARVFLGPSGVHPPAGDAPIALTDAYAGAPSFTPGVSRGTFVWRKAPGGAWEIRCSSPELNYDAFDGFLTSALPMTGAVGGLLENPGFPPGTVRVWRNDGGTFVEITAQLGLTAMSNPRDVSWVDYDNDGDLDLHVVDMGTSASPNAPDRLYRNDGAGLPFVDVAALEGVAGGAIGLGDGAAWGDLDGDLDLDLVLQEGAGPAAFFTDDATCLLLNEGDRGPALLLDLVSGGPGRAAVGAKVTVVTGTQRVTRRVQANSWRGFQDPLTVHVGLGGAAQAESVLVAWPSGSGDVIVGLPAGAYTVTEGVTGVAEMPVAAVAAWRLAAVTPQPAAGGGAQRIELALEREASLDVTVRDVAGRVVRRLHAGSLAAGRHTLTWDGTDASGRPAASGVYWIRATDGRRSAAAKAVRFR